MAEKVWRYLYPFRHNTWVWQKDGRTDRLPPGSMRQLAPLLRIVGAVKTLLNLEVRNRLNLCHVSLAFTPRTSRSSQAVHAQAPVDPFLSHAAGDAEPRRYVTAFRRTDDDDDVKLCPVPANGRYWYALLMLLRTAVAYILRCRITCTRSVRCAGSVVMVRSLSLLSLGMCIC